MTLAFIAHPIAGDVEGNLKKIRAIIRDINLNNPDVVPFVPYYADCVSLDDEILSERNRGLSNGLECLSRADELWLYGDRISSGMSTEMMTAEILGIPIIAKSKEIEDILN